MADAAREWLRYSERDRRRTQAVDVAGYKAIVRGRLMPAFGELPLESVTTAMIERWMGSLNRSAPTQIKALVLLHGIFKRAKKVWGLRVNPAADVEKPPPTGRGDIDVFSPEEVRALVRAGASEQDAALFLTPAFTGLRRGELLALRWRDLDFTGSLIRVRSSYADGVLTTPKSGECARCRSHPTSRRRWRSSVTVSTSPATMTLCFVEKWGSYLDGSALRRRYDAALKRAGPRKLRFHHLRHTFGTRMSGKADIRRVQEWMRHASIKTAMQYLHYFPREEDGRLVAEAFRLEAAPAHSQTRQ